MSSIQNKDPSPEESKTPNPSPSQAENTTRVEEKDSYETLQNLDDPKRFIRLPDHVKGLAELREKYKGKYKPLYPRRHLVRVTFNSKKITHVRIMQFNVLADGLSGLYKGKSTEKEKDFIMSPPEALKFSYRGLRIIEEIMKYDPDVITMQECDQFEFFKHYLRDYAGLFAPKKNSPCARVAAETGLNLLSDGVALFYKTRDFKLVHHRLFGKKGNERDKMDVPAIMAHLRRIKEDQYEEKDFLVLSTHLKSTKSMEGELERLQQIQFLATEVLLYQQTHFNLPIFIGCDLNAAPKEEKGFPPFTYTSIMDDQEFHKLIKEYKEKEANSKEKRPEIDLTSYDYIYNELRFTSAYKCFNGSEPPYSTWKKRKAGEEKHTIDYIFFQQRKDVEVVSVLCVPEEKDVNKETLQPGWEYPSDHFSLLATFTLMER